MSWNEVDRENETVEINITGSLDSNTKNKSCIITDDVYVIVQQAVNELVEYINGQDNFWINYISKEDSFKTILDTQLKQITGFYQSRLKKG